MKDEGEKVMKVVKKFTTFLLMLILCISLTAIPAFAESLTQDGLEVTLITDKLEYSQSEQIVTTLTVRNTNDFSIKNVSLENAVPEGYKLAENSDLKKQVESLGTGETVSVEVTYISEYSDDSENQSSNGTNTSTLSEEQDSNSSDSSLATGDNSNIIFWIGALVLACGGIIVAIVLKKKFGKKLLSLFLCLMIGGTMTVGTVIPTEAEELQQKSISVSENIKVAGEDLVISGVVKYAIDTESVDESTKPTKPENPSTADEYYWNNSEVISVIDAKDSEDVPNETEVIDILNERGFNDYPITYMYSIDGEYNNETEVSNNSVDKHPMYQTYYIDENGNFWIIFIINGDIIANPISFNLESDLAAELLISESEELTSYDNLTNKFYVTIPKESTVIVKTINEINAEALDKLTMEEISKL